MLLKIYYSEKTNSYYIRICEGAGETRRQLGVEVKESITYYSIELKQNVWIKRWAQNVYLLRMVKVIF